MPYLTADGTAVALGPWELETAADEWRGLGTYLPDWDYNTTLRIRRGARIDLATFAAQTRIAPGTPLRWSLSWRSVDTYVSGAMPPVPVDASDDRTLEAELRGEQVGGRIELYCRVVLGERHDGPVGAASDPGSILFEDRTTLTLVGEAARFPVAVIDFHAAGYDKDASFVVDVPEDLATPVHGGLLLLVNERDRALVGAIERRRVGRDADPLLQQLEEDTAVAVLRSAVERSDELRAEQADATVGAALRELGRQVHGGLERLSALRSEPPARFHTALVGEARRLGLGRQLS